MMRICAWCGRLIGDDNQPCEQWDETAHRSGSITHGICEPCKQIESARARSSGNPETEEATNE